jgi:RNA polymerase sigma factor (sigma-70 family)
LGGFNRRCRFKTWLFGIALNLCASAARRERKMRLNRVGLDESENGERGKVSLSDGFEWGAVVERVELRQRLAELPEPGRQVLELYYYADLNLREISELLKVNLSTLKYWFYQAHERLRAAVAASDEAAPQERGAKAPR